MVAVSEAKAAAVEVAALEAKAAAEVATAAAA